MQAATLGAAILSKRQALGLTQQLLARMAGLSPQFLNDIERGTVNVSVATRQQLLDVLGPTLGINDAEPRKRALWMAAKGANVSYSGELTMDELERALATGNVPEYFRPHIAQVLNEAPLQLVVGAVSEVAINRHQQPSEIWENVRTLAQTLMATRGGMWT